MSQAIAWDIDKILTKQAKDSFNYPCNSTKDNVENSSEEFPNTLTKSNKSCYKTIHNTIKHQSYRIRNLRDAQIDVGR